MEKSTSYSKIIAKVWSDPHFKAELLSNPKEALHSEGIDLPEGSINFITSINDSLR